MRQVIAVLCYGVAVFSFAMAVFMFLEACEDPKKLYHPNAPYQALTAWFSGGSVLLDF